MTKAPKFSPEELAEIGEVANDLRAQLMAMATEGAVQSFGVESAAGAVAIEAGVYRIVECGSAAPGDREAIARCLVQQFEDNVKSFLDTNHAKLQAYWQRKDAARAAVQGQVH